MVANKSILMTGNNFLLDTNIVVAWLNGDSSIANKVDKAAAVYIPIIVVGELYYGAMYSTQVQKNISKIKILVSRYNVLPIDDGVTLEYGKIKALLRKRGKPLPENDIWIAAIAQQYKLTLVTRDGHFDEIDGLKIKAW